MFTKNTRQGTFRKKSCVVATEVALALLAAPLAFAQQGAQKVEKIEVTGTRIQAPNLEGTSPVSVISAEDIKIEGVRNVENLLNNLPQVFADQGGNISNGASGTATVNLRNLGADRTLVLVNGRRMPAGSPRLFATDLNQIPAGLIRRVDVLTGGASAVYGSDAVAGVVNFIMNDTFQGAQVELNHSFFNHDQGNSVASVVAARTAGNPAQYKVPGDKSRDGKSTDLSLIVGSNFADGKGNATMFFGWKKDDALLQSERDFSSCALGSNATGFTCAGSSTSFPGRFIDLGTGTSYTIGTAPGTFRAFTANDVYNYGPLNYFQRPSERYTAAAYAHLDLHPQVRLYTEFNFHDDRTVAQIAPSGLFGQISTIGADNPLLSASQRAALGITGTTTADLFILRRNVEGGGRQDDIRHTSYRGVIGLKGDVNKNWTYDAFAQMGRVVFQETYKNDFSIARSARAIDVVTDPATGRAVCRSALNGTDPACVPYNIFTTGGVTPEALAYLSTPGFQKGHTEQQVQGITFSSDLGAYGMQLPGTKSGVGFAVGFEHRREELELSTDTAFTTGDLFGQGGPTIGLGGAYSVRDLFAEVRVPIIEGRNFAKLLSVNASYRYSDYSTGITSDSYGLGMEWQPTDLIRFRGSYQQAVRAANVVELFAAQALGLYDNNEDPCAGATPTASLAQCQRTGVTAAQYGRIIDSTAGQYNALFGGNPLLKPETSKSSTLGFVLTPLRNLSFTVDAFRIKATDVISTLPPTVVLDQCLATGQFCNLITRDQLGTLWATPQARIIATNQNLSKASTAGFDISATYRHKLGNMGGLEMNMIGTYLKEFISEPIPGLGSYDCAGLYGSGTCGTPLPEWRHKLRVSWSTPWAIDVALTWRYIDNVLFERTSTNPLLRGSGVVRDVDRELKAQNYIDLAASWNVLKWLTLRGGINNITDRDPPISSQVGAGFGNGNTFPQVYDALGRRVFLTATATF